MNDAILVLGATSAIAKAFCHRAAQKGSPLVLAGRDDAELQRLAADLQIRYQAAVCVEHFDALDWDGHADFFRRCLDRCQGRLAGVLLCYGQLGEQRATETDLAAARRTIDVNFTSAVSILNLVAEQMASQKSGFIAAIGSVAGDRGRQSNYTYGAAKSALATYLQGLRNRLHPLGVHVLTVKPGFVDTPMTQGILKPNSPLVASPERVARDIDVAVGRRRDVIYTPWYWWGIMTIIRSVPEFVFKRLRL